MIKPVKSNWLKRVWLFIIGAHGEYCEYCPCSFSKQNRDGSVDFGCTMYPMYQEPSICRRSMLPTFILNWRQWRSRRKSKGEATT